MKYVYEDNCAGMTEENFFRVRTENYTLKDFSNIFGGDFENTALGLTSNAVVVEHRKSADTSEKVYFMMDNNFYSGEAKDGSCAIIFILNEPHTDRNKRIINLSKEISIARNFGIHHTHTSINRDAFEECEKIEETFISELPLIIDSIVKTIQPGQYSIKFDSKLNSMGELKFIVSFDDGMVYLIDFSINMFYDWRKPLAVDITKINNVKLLKKGVKTIAQPEDFTNNRPHSYFGFLDGELFSFYADVVNFSELLNPSVNVRKKINILEGMLDDSDFLFIKGAFGEKTDLLATLTYPSFFFARKACDRRDYGYCTRISIPFNFCSCNIDDFNFNYKRKVGIIKGKVK